MKSGKFLSAFFSSAVILMSLNPLITARADMSYSDFAEQVAFLVNEERENQGLAPLEMSSVMNESASVRADELTELFSHTRPDGTDCFTVFDEYNISYMDFAGENIHEGSSTPEDTMQSWLNSSGHRTNILDENARYIGVGVAYSGGTYYWVQLFSDLGAYGGTNYMPTQTNPGILKGDANLDGNIDIADVVAIAGYVGDYSKNKLEPQGILNGDVHNSGNGLNANDSLMIQQYLANIITEL
ncbi:MAG: CAP domain-containing protein [Ruminococcus sp.]|nr:CAP domain-containing protein [Ruminococcus sp.]